MWRLTDMKKTDYLSKFQNILIVVLVWMMSIVVLSTTMELAFILANDFMTSPPLLNINELLDVFGYFMLVLIGIELLETLKIYATERAINVQVVFLVAMIAIARKVIILDVHETPSLTLIGIAFIIIALSAGYYLVKKSQEQAICKIL